MPHLGIQGKGIALTGSQSKVEIGSAANASPNGLVLSGRTVLDFKQTELDVHGCTKLSDGTLVVKNKMSFKDVNTTKGVELWKTDCLEGSFTSIEVDGFSAQENACLSTRYAKGLFQSFPPSSPSYSYWFSVRGLFLVCSNSASEDSVFASADGSSVPIPVIVSVVVIVYVNTL